MELHQLRYFCAVAETGSFSRAAEHSHVAQPSLSQQILKLEDELGARLFDRLGRSVRLTDVGKAFLPRARAVLRELEAAKGDVVQSKDSVAGTLTVGVIPTIAPYFLPQRLTSFTRQFPQGRLTVVEEITRCRIRASTSMWPFSRCPRPRIRCSRAHRAPVRGASQKARPRRTPLIEPQRPAQRAVLTLARRPLLPRHRHCRVRPCPPQPTNHFREWPI